MCTTWFGMLTFPEMGTMHFWGPPWPGFCFVLTKGAKPGSQPANLYKSRSFCIDSGTFSGQPLANHLISKSKLRRNSPFAGLK